MTDFYVMFINEHGHFLNYLWAGKFTPADNVVVQQRTERIPLAKVSSTTPLSTAVRAVEWNATPAAIPASRTGCTASPPSSRRCPTALCLSSLRHLPSSCLCCSACGSLCVYIYIYI